jgi:phytoene/squalene synthetase
MMDLYNTTTFECSKLITEYYSTSFTLGIKTLDKRFHFPIYAIYGFVRYADEIVDTFHGFDKKALLNTFRTDTFKAIDEKISLNPVIHSFQMVVNEYQIDHDLIKAFYTLWKWICISPNTIKWAMRSIFTAQQRWWA